jgi:hypothetical protein
MIVKSVGLSLVVLLVGGIAGCAHKKASDGMMMNSGDSMSMNQPSTQASTYTCTMHPEVRSDKPGNCPKCGMALVPKK